MSPLPRPRHLNGPGVVAICLALLALGIVIVRSLGWLIDALVSLPIWQLVVVAAMLLLLAGWLQVAGRVHRQAHEIESLRSELAELRARVEATTASVTPIGAARRPRAAARRKTA